MTKTEMLARIEKLETAKFLLDMKDHWNARDWQDSAEMVKEILALKKAVKSLE